MLVASCACGMLATIEAAAAAAAEASASAIAFGILAARLRLWQASYIRSSSSGSSRSSSRS
eukprot:12365899-Heterocapsa_arctica.AAC.1